jgi:hypothetical protein
MTAMLITVRAAKLRKISGCGLVPWWHIFYRDIERGEEIQEGQARCPGAKEGGDEKGKAG